MANAYQRMIEIEADNLIKMHEGFKIAFGIKKANELYPIHLGDAANEVKNKLGHMEEIYLKPKKVIIGDISRAISRINKEQKEKQNKKENIENMVGGKI